MTDRDPKHLHPIIKPILVEHEGLASRFGITTRLIETWRGPLDQNKAKADGASDAAWGQSWHNTTFQSGRPCSLAYHLAIVDEGGKSLEGFGANKLSALDIERYTFVGRLGEHLGLTWGGRWKSDDFTHFELRIAALSIVKAALALGNDVAELRRV